jgi:histidinol dehydrogenase
MNVIRFSDPDFAGQLRVLASTSSLFDQTIEERTRSILKAVQSQGDAALVEFTERFDGAKLSVGQLAVSTPEFLTASLEADEALRKAMAFAGKNIESFSRKMARVLKLARSSTRFTESESTSLAAPLLWFRPA